jgi:hypothetical protein
MTTLYKQRIYCTTDSKWEYVWTETETPIVNCPTDSGHSVNANSVSVIDTLSNTEVKLQVEETPANQQKTGGKYQLLSEAFDCPGNTVTDYTFSFKYPISVLAGYIYSEASMQGDVSKIDIAKDTVIGIVTSDVNDGATGLNVNSTAIDNILAGQLVSVTDGVNASDYIVVSSVDTIGENISLSSPLVGPTGATGPAYASGSYVRVSVCFANVEFGPPGKYEIGTNTMGSSYVPAETTITFSYDNKTSTLKRPVFVMEIFY